jgi:hypothetical protein
MVVVVVTAVAMFASLGGVGLAQSAISLAQYQYGKKVTICHKQKNTITISVRAWPAHKRHGDSQGACVQAKKHGNGKGAGKHGAPGVQTTVGGQQGSSGPGKGNAGKSHGNGNVNVNVNAGGNGNGNGGQGNGKGNGNK